MICNDRLSSCTPDSPSTRCTRTLGVGSTSSGRSCVPFWSSRSEELSKKLWWPTVTDWAVLRSTTSNGCSNDLVSRSQWPIWWKRIPDHAMSSPTTFSLSSLSSPVETKDCGDMRSLKIRIRPTVEQRVILRQWIDATRYLYNQSLQLVRKDSDRKISFYDLRNELATAKNITDPKKQWLKKIPNCIRQSGVKQLTEAFKTNFAKQLTEAFKTNFAKQRKDKQRFQVHYRSKKRCKTEVTEVDKRKTNILCGNRATEAFIQLFPRFMKQPIRMKDSKRTIRKIRSWESIRCDFKIQYMRRVKQWYLILPYREPKQFPNAPLTPPHPHVALDPGVRIFQTCYSDTAGAGTLGAGVMEHMEKHVTRIDRIQSLLDKNKKKLPTRKKKSRWRLIHRLWKKVSDIRSHVHNSMINVLLDHLETILLPEFGTQKMMQNENQGRVIGKRTTRQMALWGHYQFKTKLLYQALLRGGRNRVHIVDESFTTMTCGKCGALARNINGKRTFVCPHCFASCHRDVQAARNIFLKHLA